MLFCPDPDLLQRPVASLAAPARAKIIWLGSLALAAAAAVAVMLVRPAKTIAPAVAAPPVFAARIEQRTLEDGSVVESLNRGAEIAVNFTPGERRVALLKGEANFEVAKNKERPFIVSAGGVDVRAVGTAFNVRLDFAGGGCPRHRGHRAGCQTLAGRPLLAGVPSGLSASDSPTIPCRRRAAPASRSPHGTPHCR